MASCKDCIYFDKKTVDNGPCRRYAPRITVGIADVRSDYDNPFLGIWPEVGPDDWCGEFEGHEYIGGKP